MKPTLGRILIADDEPLIRQLLSDFLTGKGYDVVTAESGAQALDAVPSFQPNAMLLDMLMPGLSATEFLVALRRTGATVPVILISGAPVVGTEEFFGVLTKPFNLRTMAELVAAAVDRGRTTSA